MKLLCLLPVFTLCLFPMWVLGIRSDSECGIPVADLNCAPQQNAENADSIKFSWSCYLHRLVHRGGKVVALVTMTEIDRDTTLTMEDAVVFAIKVYNACYVYLICHGSDGEWKMLLSFESSMKENFYRIPSDRPFEIQNTPGDDRFYLIVSNNRLDSLELAFRSYQGSKVFQTTEGLIRELNKIRRRFRPTWTIEVKKPPRLAGILKRPAKLNAELNVEESLPPRNDVTSAQLYVKVLRITHKVR